MRKIALIATLFILCLSGAAFAQTQTQFCGTLSQADCAILTNSHTAMQSLDSVSFDMNMNFNATNVPNMTNPVTLTLTGQGSFAGLNAVRSGATSAQTDPGAAVVNALQNLTGDLTLTLNLPADMAAQQNMPSSITLQIRLVDGVGYLNTDTLASFMGSAEATPTIKGWYGIDLANLVKSILQANPNLFQNMMSMAGTSGATGGVNPMAYMQQFNNPDLLNKFVKIERTDNGSGDTATFVTTIDFAALAQSPEFQSMMQQQMQTQMQNNPNMSAADQQMAMQMSGMMMQNMTMTVTEDIGTSDNFVHDIKASFSLDTSAMMAFVTPEAGSTSSSTSAPVVNVDFTLNLSNFNSAPAVTAPDGAQVIPYQSIAQMLGGMMSSMGSSMMPNVTPEPTTAG